MPASVVHFAVLNPDRTVTPLCGQWSGGTDWITMPDAVTCPECLRLLRQPVRRDGPRGALGAAAGS